MIIAALRLYKCECILSKLFFRKITTTQEEATQEVMCLMLTKQVYFIACYSIAYISSQGIMCALANHIINLSKWTSILYKTGHVEERTPMAQI